MLPIRTFAGRLLACLAMITLASAAGPARAQLGTSPNVPPQRLFDTDQPARLNDGLGTMADPAPKPAVVKRVRRHARR